MLDETESTIVVALTGDDQERFCRYVLARSRLDRRLAAQSVASAVLGLVFVALVAWLAAGADWYQERLPASIAIIVAVLWIGFVLFYHRARLRLLLQRFRQHRSGPERVTVSAGGVAVASEKGAADLPWAAFVAVEVTPPAIYLFVDGERGMIIPCHAFTDEAAYRRYGEQLRSFWSRGRMDFAPSIS